MAKDQKQEQNPIPDPDVQETLGPPKSYRLQIALGLVALILFQMIMMYLILPGKQTPHRNGLDTRSGPGVFDDTLAPSPANLLPTVAMVEKPIKDSPFRIVQVRNEDNEEFSLTMHVTVRRTDANKFQTRYEQCTQQIVARVTDVLALTTPEERSGEFGYNAITERVKKVINDVLGTSWVQEVFLTDISYKKS